MIIDLEGTTNKNLGIILTVRKQMNWSKKKINYKKKNFQNKINNIL